MNDRTKQIKSKGVTSSSKYFVLISISFFSSKWSKALPKMDVNRDLTPVEEPIAIYTKMK